MKKSKFTDSQIMDAVKRVEAGFTVPDICRDLGISTATFYKWRAKYGGMDVSMMSRMKELEDENRRLKKMYLEEKLKAEINGVAIGVGATITLACDIRLASSRARFGFVFGKIGIVPDACSSWFLPKVVGLPKALEWTLSGEFIGAEGALNAGLVSELCEPESLLNRAYELANAFTTSRSPVSVALIRQMLYRNASFEHPMQAHKVESLGIFYTSMADGKEGVSAFLNKRQPNYEGLASAMPDFYPWWN